MEISKRITEARKKNGLSQESLAAELHVSLQTLRRWEHGQSFPDVMQLMQLCEAFGVEPQYFLTDECDTLQEEQGMSALTAYKNPYLGEMDPEGGGRAEDENNAIVFEVLAPTMPGTEGFHFSAERYRARTRKIRAGTLGILVVFVIAVVDIVNMLLFWMLDRFFQTATYQTLVEEMDLSGVGAVIFYAFVAVAAVCGLLLLLRAIKARKRKK